MVLSPLLIYAIGENQIEITKFLLDRHTDSFTWYNQNNCYYLIHAAIEGAMNNDNLEIIKYILERDITQLNKHTNNEEKLTPLRVAARTRLLEMTSSGKHGAVKWALEMQ